MSITITGHSLGSALAILSAYDIAESGLDKPEKTERIPISVMSFSGPRVGNTRFKKRVQELGIKVLRVFNIHDKVPNIPGVLFNERTSALVQWISDWTSFFYSHIGEELSLDHTRSSFVKEKLDLVSIHNLELLLHLLDGYAHTSYITRDTLIYLFVIHRLCLFNGNELTTGIMVKRGNLG